jgi:hypothetical protein
MNMKGPFRGPFLYGDKFMMMMRLFLFLCVFLCSTNAYAESYSKRLERLDHAGQEEALFKALLKQDHDSSDFVTALDFLKAKIINDRVGNADYHAIYAMMLWSAGIKDTSAAIAVAALLILQTDQARCKDRTAGHIRLASRTTMMQDMIMFLIKQDDAEKEKIIGIAWDIEESINSRMPNRSLCYSGIEATQKALKHADENEIKLEETGKQSYVIPDFDHIKVDYLQGDEWHKARRAVRDKFYRQLMEQ